MMRRQAWSRSVAATFGILMLFTAHRGAAADAKKKTAPARIAPTIMLASPADNTLFKMPAVVEIDATLAAGRRHVRDVSFFSNGALIGAVRQAPYTWRWKPAVGSYSLTAVATVSSKRRQIVSAPVHVRAAFNVAPSVAITKPDGTSPFYALATITVTADAKDSDGIVKQVVFSQTSSAGTHVIGTSTSAPFSVTWSSVAAGAYSITATATDDNGASTTSAPVSITVRTPGPQSEPLVQPLDLNYEGAFRVPPGPAPGANLTDWQALWPMFNYGGAAIAFNAANQSLFVVGHVNGQLVAEIGVPAIINSTVVTNLVTAPLLQRFNDVTDRLMDSVHPGATLRIGGLLPYGSHLYASVFDNYDGDQTQVVSHFASGLDLSVNGDALGPYQVGGVAGKPDMTGFLDGYFAIVPEEWRSLVGGPVLNGNCCINVIGRTSSGPAAFAIDPAQLGAVTPLPATPLVYYPLNEPLAPNDTTNPLFNLATEIKGVVFPDGTRSVLFFGRHGTGTYCYGPGTTDPNLIGTPADGGVDKWCFDPDSAAKGTHAYPYRYYVWAYDANDLVGVKNGTTLPWNVRPYAVWPLSLPLPGDSHILGATYDPAMKRIFLSQAFGDGELPAIHVFTVTIH
jgi:Big-like domain-containing protein